MQVIGLKMECVVESFESDPEGLGIAGEINKHLPGQVLHADQHWPHFHAWYSSFAAHVLALGVPTCNSNSHT